MLVVTKFGGSSLSCATQFAKVKNIVMSDAKRKIVVVSALGKRDSKDTKITDLLYILHAHLKYSVPYDDIWNMIVTRFVGVQEELGIKYNIIDDLNSLKNELNKSISEDYLVSRGEYLTAKLMSSYLGYAFVDAKDIISSICFKFTSLTVLLAKEKFAKENNNAINKKDVSTFIIIFLFIYLSLLKNYGTIIPYFYAFFNRKQENKGHIKDIKTIFVNICVMKKYKI